MRRLLQTVLLFAAIPVALLCAEQQAKSVHVVDRIVVVVNLQVITESDWDEQERLEILADGRLPAEHLHHQETLERLVKRVLIVQQMNSLDFQRATSLEIDERVVAVRKLFPSAATDVGWIEHLRSYGVDEPSLRRYLSEQLDMLRFIDAKFRTGIRISQRDAMAYYNDELVPQWKNRNVAVPPFQDVRNKVIAILTEKRVDELLEEWLKELQAEGLVQWKDNAAQGKK